MSPHSVSGVPGSTRSITIQLPVSVAVTPAEVLHLREADCKLPDDGWGELLLTGSTHHVGRAWADGDDAREDRGFKHRPRKDTRHVPACPELVAILQRHLRK
ncbi:MAG: hypothetical protein ACRDP4_12405, partial [Nocardioidaceae bacterium]